MRIDNPSRAQLAAYFRRLDERAVGSGSLQFVKFLDLGTHVVRLVNYSADFTPHIEKQLTYVLKDAAPREADATLVVWHEKDIASLSAALDDRCNPGKIPFMRVRKLAKKSIPDWQLQKLQPLQIFAESYSRHHPLLKINMDTRIAAAHNPESKTYYYAAANLEPETFIKRGHIFVLAFNDILKSRFSGLAHGAAVSLEGKGVLFCARGQRGKSTLAVLALLNGFDYVADDYLVLEHKENGLYAWPIYSIITLAPMMYNDLYGRLEAKFVSNNARKDKYVFNISSYHHRFASPCPIHLCMFPQIVSNPEPSIEVCTQAGKGRAAAQLILSTITQMGDKHDTATIRKLVAFVRDLPFYQINLCRDIEKNLACLREFLRGGTYEKQVAGPGQFSSYAVRPTVFDFN
jgi:hypothetical protein